MYAKRPFSGSTLSSSNPGNGSSTDTNPATGTLKKTLYKTHQGQEFATHTSRRQSCSTSASHCYQLEKILTIGWHGLSQQSTSKQLTVSKFELRLKFQIQFIKILKSTIIVSLRVLVGWHGLSQQSTCNQLTVSKFETELRLKFQISNIKFQISNLIL